MEVTLQCSNHVKEKFLRTIAPIASQDFPSISLVLLEDSVKAISFQNPCNNFDLNDLYF
jgi:hypothetical protein